ncbi:hypothetical protein [Nocardia arthritidis]|nr:hypothetical protein [Nocardia arthritidis]
MTRSPTPRPHAALIRLGDTGAAVEAPVVIDGDVVNGQVEYIGQA